MCKNIPYEGKLERVQQVLLQVTTLIQKQNKHTLANYFLFF